MRRIVLLVLFTASSVWAASTHASDSTYEGQWHTTNRKLDGTMTCVVTDFGNENWQGRFFGVWQGVPFDYTVRFAGPPDKLHGTAVIDGANYSWTGQMSSGAQGRFKATFTGNRYLGNFDLQQRPH